MKSPTSPPFPPSQEAAGPRGSLRRGRALPPVLDETSLTLALSELAGEMEVIPSRHTAKVSKEISNGIHTGTCHVLACVKLALPDTDLKVILSKGAADATREDMSLV